MGVVGRGVRVIVGLEKTSDKAAAGGDKLIDLIEPARLLISLLIGAVAGVIAAVATVNLDAPIPRDTLLGFAAAGYSGADLVEGFMARYLSSNRVQTTVTAAAAEVVWPALSSARALAGAGAVSQRLSKSAGAAGDC
jgi:hypothetical protein